MIFDIQFLQIPICRTSYLSQILASLWGMEDNGRNPDSTRAAITAIVFINPLCRFNRMVIFPAICNTNVQLLFQRYEKNRKGKPFGGRNLRKKRVEALEVARKTSLRLCGQFVYRNSSMNKSISISDKEYKEWVKRNIYYCKQFYLLYSPALETLPQTILSAIFPGT